MKKHLILLIVLLTPFFVLSQSFEKNWEKVLELEAEGKTKSAFEETQKIYRKAKRKQVEIQIIKTFFYTSKYLQVLEEDAQITILKNLNTEIKDLSISSASILQYIYAECLKSHLTRNHYQINKLTALDSTSSDDFRTWPRNILENKIESAYEQSIKHEATLKKKPLSDYELIFDFETYETLEETSLFDFLASEAANYYGNKISNYTEDVALIEKKKEELFETSQNFQNFSFEEFNNKYLKKYLSLCQKREHGSLKNQEFQFQRIQFLKNTFFYSDNEFYLKKLNAFQKTHLFNENLQKVLLEKARIYRNEASKELKPKNNILAVATYDSILNLSRSATYKLAQYEKQQIANGHLRINLQKEIYPNQVTRAFIEYKNTDNLTVSFYKINHNTFSNHYNDYKKNEEQFKKIIKERTPEKKEKYHLIDKKDYFEYTTEVLLPKLDVGHYLVSIESKSSDSLHKLKHEYQTITVTNLAAFSFHKNKKLFFKVHDRKTGKPIEDVSIASNEFETKTDEFGSVSVASKDKDYYNIPPVTLSKDKDSLIIFSSYINSLSEEIEKETEPNIALYLDRAIYRPGQKIYFKGIAFWKKDNASEVVPNLTAKVSLNNANNETINEIKLISNEFGSFSGEFTLPKSGLTGNFSLIVEEPDDLEKDPIYDKKENKHPFWDNIRYNTPRIDFRVEEYKRPKFEIKFDPTKETFVVNKPITVKGIATAFSGSPITNSKVTYSVTRETTNKYGSFDEYEKTILQGETETDNNGKFSIVFNAEPNTSSDKENLPVFTYTISVNITDINGESRKNETTVKAGYHSYEIDLKLPKKIKTAKPEKISIASTNLNNHFVPVTGELKFYFISAIENKWKRRQFGTPELKTISDEDFELLFPYEKSETNSETPEKLIHTKKITTSKDQTLSSDFMNYWKTGFYKAVFTTKDSLHNTIEKSFAFELSQSKDTFQPSSELFSVKQLNSNPKKEGYVLFEIQSNFTDLYLYADAFHHSQLYESRTFVLENKRATIKIPIQKDFKNGINVQFHTIFDNTAQEKGVQVLFYEEIPKLVFETETFRNKIEPGSKEQWSFKIKNNERKEVEVLASMYDFSLDQFTAKDWKTPTTESQYYNFGRNFTHLGFEYTSLNVNFNNNWYSQNQNAKNPTLFWFGFNFSNAKDYYTKLRYEKSKHSKTKKLPANAKLISGLVLEGGLPLPGVSVVVKGTKRGTQTDMDGYYAIDAAQGE